MMAISASARCRITLHKTKTDMGIFQWGCSCWSKRVAPKRFTHFNHSGVQKGRQALAQEAAALGVKPLLSLRRVLQRRTPPDFMVLSIFQHMISCTHNKFC